MVSTHNFHISSTIWEYSIVDIYVKQLQAVISVTKNRAVVRGISASLVVLVIPGQFLFLKKVNSVDPRVEPFRIYEVHYSPYLGSLTSLNGVN
jgi:hypothetical protein